MPRDRAPAHRSRRRVSLEFFRQKIAGRSQPDHQVMMGFPHSLRFLIGRIIKPGEPHLADLHILEFVLAMDEPAQVIVMLVGAHDDIESLSRQRLVDLARDGFQSRDGCS
jgi:hypothetical protein